MHWDDTFIDFSGVLDGTETVSVLLFFVFVLVNPSDFCLLLFLWFFVKWFIFVGLFIIVGWFIIIELFIMS